MKMTKGETGSRGGSRANDVDSSTERWLVEIRAMEQLTSPRTATTSAQDHQHHKTVQVAATATKYAQHIIDDDDDDHHHQEMMIPRTKAREEQQQLFVSIFGFWIKFTLVMSAVSVIVVLGLKCGKFYKGARPDLASTCTHSLAILWYAVAHVPKFSPIYFSLPYIYDSKNRAKEKAVFVFVSVLTSILMWITDGIDLSDGIDSHDFLFLLCYCVFLPMEYQYLPYRFWKASVEDQTLIHPPSSSSGADILSHEYHVAEPVDINKQVQFKKFRFYSLKPSSLMFMYLTIFWILNGFLHLWMYFELHVTHEQYNKLVFLFFIIYTVIGSTLLQIQQSWKHNIRFNVGYITQFMTSSLRQQIQFLVVALIWLYSSQIVSADGDGIQLIVSTALFHVLIKFLIISLTSIMRRMGAANDHAQLIFMPQSFEDTMAEFAFSRVNSWSSFVVFATFEFLGKLIRDSGGIRAPTKMKEETLCGWRRLFGDDDADDDLVNFMLGRRRSRSNDIPEPADEHLFADPERRRFQLRKAVQNIFFETAISIIAPVAMLLDMTFIHHTSCTISCGIASKRTIFVRYAILFIAQVAISLVSLRVRFTRTLQSVYPKEKCLDVLILHKHWKVFMSSSLAHLQDHSVFFLITSVYSVSLVMRLFRDT